MNHDAQLTKSVSSLPANVSFLTLPPVAEPRSRILRLPEVIERVGLRRASIYSHMARGLFPKSITLGPRAVGWLENEINDWITARIEVTRHEVK